MKKGKYGLLIKTSVATWVLVSLAAAAILFVITPHKISSDYSQKVHAEAGGLGESFVELEDTLDLGIFSTPDASAEQNLADIKIIEEKINKATASVKDFQKQVATYPKAQYTSLSFVYNEADATAQNVGFIVAQSMEVLESYAELTAFLRAVSQAMSATEKNLDYINSIRDFNLHLDSHEDIGKRAQEVKRANDLLEKAAVPPEYAAVQKTLSERSKLLADTLVRLAAGLQAASDSQIYRAVSVVEEIAESHYGSYRNQLFNASQDSPTLAGVRDLTDKLIILEGPEH